MIVQVKRSPPAASYELRILKQVLELADQREYSALHDLISDLIRSGISDPLTGLLNLRGLHNVLRDLVPLFTHGDEERRESGERRRRRPRSDRRHLNLPISVVFMDLDGLHEINEKVDHSGGDLVIKVFAKTLVVGFRSDDIVARKGGDEFVAVLPGIGAETVHSRMDEIRGAFKSLIGDYGFTDKENNSVHLEPNFTYDVDEVRDAEDLDEVIAKIEQAIDEADRKMMNRKRRRAQK